MNDIVRKIFDMLGVEPYEEFGLKNKCGDISFFYKIDENLNIFFKCSSSWERSYINLVKFFTGKYEIVKLSNKKKLRDLTKEEYKKWYRINCGTGSCANCPFVTANCSAGSKHCWVTRKDLYSDKFLDQKVEIPE